MYFTQYLLPHGERRPVHCQRPPEIEAKAMELISRGCEFEVEVLSTGVVNMEVLREGDCVCGELCDNGPEIPEHVDKLVNRAYAIVVEGKDEEK